MNESMYLYSVEFCDEKYCEFSCSQRLFLSIEEAKRTMTEEIENFVKSKKDNYDFKIEATDGMSVKFQQEYDSPTHFSNHCWFTIDEIKPEDGEAYSLYDDYYHMEVEEAFESITGDDAKKYSSLIGQLADLVKNDKTIMETIDYRLAEIVGDNEEVKQIIAKINGNKPANA